MKNVSAILAILASSACSQPTPPSLDAPRVGNITFTVRTNAGIPIHCATVVLIKDGRDGQTEFTDPNGRTILTEIPAGTHEFTAYWRMAKITKQATIVGGKTSHLDFEFSDP